MIRINQINASYNEKYKSISDTEIRRGSRLEKLNIDLTKFNRIGLLASRAHFLFAGFLGGQFTRGWKHKIKCDNQMCVIIREKKLNLFTLLICEFTWLLT